MRSRRGARWAICTISGHDRRSGITGVPESFAKLETMLKTGTPLLMKARVQVEEAGTRLSLLEARRLEEIPWARLLLNFDCG